MDSGPPAAAIFFVHVMKTGGTALGRLLGECYDPARTYPDAGVETFNQKSNVDELLGLGPERWAEIDYYAPHMPAWVAEVVAPGHTHVTVLREPVARTISHLRQVAEYTVVPDDLEAIYDLDDWRIRLTNFQTRCFGTTQQDHADENVRIEELVRSAELAVDDMGFAASLATGVRLATPLVASHLDAARTRLASIDVVGVADRLPLVAGLLERRFDLRLGELRRVNTAPNDLAVSDSLIRRIRDDNQMDLELYDLANELVDEQETQP